MYNPEEYLAGMNEKVCACDKCGIAPNRGWGWGNIRSRIMFIAQNPGWQPESLTEDIIPFGILKGGENSGRYFMKFIHAKGLNSFQYYITNTIKCPTPKNRAPSKKETKNCLNFLKFELILQRPRHIVLMGKVATNVYNDHLKSFLKTKGMDPKTFHVWHPGYIQRMPQKFDDWTYQGKGINTWQ